MCRNVSQVIRTIWLRSLICDKKKPGTVLYEFEQAAFYCPKGITIRVQGHVLAYNLCYQPIYYHCLMPIYEQQPWSYRGGDNNGEDDIKMKPTTRTQCPTKGDKFFFKASDYMAIVGHTTASGKLATQLWTTGLRKIRLIYNYMPGIVRDLE